MGVFVKNESLLFREPLIRWFQFGVSSLLCRLHGSGSPQPSRPELPLIGTSGRSRPCRRR
jgi:hypothetical protein